MRDVELKDWGLIKGPIGLFGGTFDPIQSAHVAIAQKCLQWVKHIVFIPNRINPLKTNGPIASEQQRVEMISKSIFGNPSLYFSLIELTRATDVPSYSIDTVLEIKKLTKEKIFFIMGEDCLRGFSRWQRVTELVDMLDGFIIYPRETTILQSDDPFFTVLNPQQQQKVLSGKVSGDFFDISASDVREAILKKKSWSNLVPENVELYIKENKLYGY